MSCMACKVWNVKGRYWTYMRCILSFSASSKHVWILGIGKFMEKKLRITID